MGKRFFWFAVGVGLTAFVVLKGKEYYQRFTPAGVSDRIEKTTKLVGSWVDDFVDTMTKASAEREAELREALTMEEAPATT